MKFCWVLSTGEILNDFDEDVDHLGYGVYAKALAQQIEKLNPPCTVGIFGRWGAGKSFLLKYVRSKVNSFLKFGFNYFLNMNLHKSKKLVTSALGKRHLVYQSVFF